MVYMGSKRRVSKYLIPIMAGTRGDDQWWVEPFVGGGNMIDKVGGKRSAGDANPYAIQALISIRDHIHELPKNNFEFTEEDYKKLKLSDDYPHKGHAGFAYSFGSVWLSGWAKNKEGRDYVRKAFNKALDQTHGLQGVKLVHANYKDLKIPPNSLIYCDPPYQNTISYKGVSKFDHDEFWQWCRDKSNEGHTVYVSEYNAPDDFECVCAKGSFSNLKGSVVRKPIERLYRV